jgi:hypothetical protein
LQRRYVSKYLQQVLHLPLRAVLTNLVLRACRSGSST